MTQKQQQSPLLINRLSQLTLREKLKNSAGWAWKQLVDTMTKKADCYRGQWTCAIPERFQSWGCNRRKPLRMAGILPHRETQTKIETRWCRNVRRTHLHKIINPAFCIGRCFWYSSWTAQCWANRVFEVRLYFAPGPVTFCSWSATFWSLTI